MGFFDIFKRGANIAEANAHSALDKIEDPVKMTEQAIRTMEGQLTKAVEAQAGIKSRAIQLKSERQKLKTDSAEWSDKATKLKAKYKVNDGDEALQAQLKDAILDCLNKVENLDLEAASKEKLANATTLKSDNFGKRIKELKTNIDTAKSTLGDLKSRSEVSKAEKEINKQFTDLGDDTAMSMIKKMQEKVSKQEAEAEAYTELANEDKSLETSIDDLLAVDSPTENNKLLDDFLKD